MRIFWVIGFIFVSYSFAQPNKNQFEIGGYVKYLISRSDIPASGVFNDHLLHNRLNGKWYATDALTMACEIRTRIYYGGLVEHTPQFAELIGGNYNLADLDILLWNSQSSVGYTEIDRLWADCNLGQWQITLGRQRLALGTNLVWNPTDIFNPYSVLDFDYEERPGFDGVHVQYYLGPLSKIEFAVKPGRTSETSAAVAAITTNIFEYDFHILVANRSELWLLGGSWAGDIAGAGFRGEATFSQKPLQIFQGLYDHTKTDGIMSTAAVSVDYTFPSSFYIHVESLYNSAGVTQDAGLFALQSQKLGLLSPARWSLFTEAAYDITPLLRGSFITILNPTDRSYVLVPSLTWSALTNLDLMFLSLIFQGDTFTEFAGYGNSIYARFQFSF